MMTTCVSVLLRWETQTLSVRDQAMALSGKIVHCCYDRLLFKACKQNGKETKNRQLGEFLKLQPSSTEVYPELGVWQWRMVLGDRPGPHAGSAPSVYNHLYCLVCLPMTWDREGSTACSCLLLRGWTCSVGGSAGFTAGRETVSVVKMELRSA